MRKVVIAGGSGFIGKALVKEFGANGYEVVVLSRTGNPVEGARAVQWDGKTIGTWQEELSGAEVVVNLCGESVMQRWTPASLQRIRDSRVKTTELIGEAISRCAIPPKTWLNASAIGWYGDTGAREVSEASPAAEDRLGKMCEDWESAVGKAATPNTVKTKVRIGIVFGQGSQAFQQLTRITKMAIGGQLGAGKQYFSWIHIKDLARLFVWAANNPTEGSLNATAPEPVTNVALMSSLRKHLGMPIAPPLPVFVAKAMSRFMGWDSQMLLGGTRAVPAIALARGFEYKFSSIEGALTDLIDDVPDSWKATKTLLA